ncbi:hypothetical protein [Nocardia gipuzkoensis]
MSEVDDAVDLIDGHYDPSVWAGLGGDGTGFQDDQARESLEALAGLADQNADDFEAAFNRLSPTLRETLAETAERQGLGDQDKYRQIVRALAESDPTGVVNAETEEENEAAEPEFASYGSEVIPPEGEDGEWDDLHVPKGASAQLKALVEDTDFAMREGYRTLGDRNPQAAPGFTNVLGSEQIATVDGWSRIRHAHGELQGQLDTRQQEHDAGNGDVVADTEDSANLIEETSRRLRTIRNELDERLRYEPSHTIRDGDEIRSTTGDPLPSTDPVIAGLSPQVIYRMNTIEDSAYDGKFVLTPEAEHLYYIRHIEQAAEDWEREYANVTEQFQRIADEIDNTDNDDREDDDREDNGDDRSLRWAGRQHGDGGGSPYPVEDASVEQADFQAEDWSSTYDDLLTEPAETTGLVNSEYDDLLTEPAETAGLVNSDTILDSGIGDTATSADLGSLVQAALQNPSGTGTGTGLAPVSVAPSAANSGTDIWGLMAMSALSSQAANQMNRPPTDHSGYDDLDSREARQRERDRNRQATATTTNPGAQTTPPGVTAPTYAGSPPPITTPGTMVDVLIDNTKVQASPPVAEALQNQIRNVALDAKTAYEGTMGELTANNPPASVEDLANLKTGDIVQWEKHSALIVRDQNGLHVLDNGHLVSLDPNNPPLKEKYGNFTGYLHPTGLDGAAGADPGTTAPPPPTVSTAQPSGPPPVEPPHA